MKMRTFIAALLLMVAGLQTAWGQGFRVYKTDGTIMQFSLRTDSIVFYDDIGTDIDFGPFTPVNQMIVGTWYVSKYATVTFNEDGTTDYISGATYEFMPYQGTIIINNANGMPVNILKIHKVTSEMLVVSTLGSETFSVWSVTQPVQLVTSITLSETSLTLRPDNIVTLAATVLPEDADNKAVEWTSSDETVAEVNANGRVIANAYGTCTITATAADGSGVKAECQVTVKSDKSGVIDGREYVDLGLPSGTLWATCNIGAENPEDYGDYFAWGETSGYNSGKTTFSWGTYKYSNYSGVVTKYCTDSDSGTIDNKSEPEAEDDAAAVNWGSGWQMPSKAQCEELIDESYTTTTWTTLNDVNGCLIVSKSNDNRIFLPAAGYRSGASLNDAGSSGFYWSRSLRSSPSRYGCSLYLGSNYIGTYYEGRYSGRPVRPVRVQ